MTSELRPCPFCGSDDLAVMELLSRGLRIECEGCGTYSPVVKDGPALLTAWNTRVVSHPPTTNPVVDHETGNMSDKQRDAVPVVWGEPSPPNDESSYDHCIASFKFGTLKAEWKSWKDHPGYTVFFEGCNNFIGTYNTLADAKKAGETWVSTALEKDV